MNTSTRAVTSHCARLLIMGYDCKTQPYTIAGIGHKHIDLHLLMFNYAFFI